MDKHGYEADPLWWSMIFRPVGSVHFCSMILWGPGFDDLIPICGHRLCLICPSFIAVHPMSRCDDFFFFSGCFLTASQGNRPEVPPIVVFHRPPQKGAFVTPTMCLFRNGWDILKGTPLQGDNMVSGCPWNASIVVGDAPATPGLNSWHWLAASEAEMSIMLTFSSFLPYFWVLNMCCLSIAMMVLLW